MVRTPLDLAQASKTWLFVTFKRVAMEVTALSIGPSWSPLMGLNAQVNVVREE